MSNVSITKPELDKALEAQTDQIAVLFQDFMQQVDERFNKVESSLDRLTSTIDGFIKRLEEVEVEQTARDAQVQRIYAWAREVSAKTGIPIKDL